MIPQGTSNILINLARISVIAIVSNSLSVYVVLLLRTPEWGAQHVPVFREEIRVIQRAATHTVEYNAVLDSVVIRRDD